MAVSLFAPGLKDDFEAHATLELQHADLLAQRIQQLGGVPIYSPVDIAAQAASVGVRPEQGPTLREMIVENLMLERQQVAACICSHDTGHMWEASSPHLVLACLLRL